jgi:hypothetical protein
MRRRSGRDPKAQQVVNGHDVELWERDRSIVRFSHDDQQIGQS